MDPFLRILLSRKRLNRTKLTALVYGFARFLINELAWNRSERVLDDYTIMGSLTNLMMIVDFPSGIWARHAVECIVWLGYQQNWPVFRRRFLWGITCRKWLPLSSYHAGLSMTRNGLGIIPLYVLVMGAKLTPESGFEDEVQDILGCRMKCTKINCPSVGFMRSQLCKKISWGTNFLQGNS